MNKLFITLNRHKIFFKERLPLVMDNLQGLFLNRSLNIMVGFLGDPDMLPRAGDVTSERLKAARV